MDTCGTTRGDERTVTMLWANTWGLNFLVFAILADTVYLIVGSFITKLPGTYWR